MNARGWHSLLQRQLRHICGDRPVPPEWRPLLEMVDRAYRQADADRQMLERSMELSSNELLQANRDLRSIFSLLPDMFFRIRSDGVILDANIGPHAQIGHTPELRGTRLQDLHLTIEGRALMDLLEIAQRAGERVLREIETQGDRPHRFVEASVVPLHEGQFVIFVRDISQRRRAEEEIQRLAASVEQAADAIVITDTTGFILYVNPAFEHIMGYARAEVIGKTPSLLKSGRHDAQFYERLWSTISSERTWRGRLTDRRKDDTLVELNTTISPVRDSTGKIVNYVAVSHDITREADLQDQLRQAQKMEAIGRLAGGIAHDFNNLLTAILGNAELVLRRLGPSAAVREDVEQIREAAQQAAALVSQLLTFSRKQVVNPKVLSINESVANMARMLKRLIGDAIRLETELDPQAGLIRIDPVQLEQVIMNLALNARDAMPNGGRLTLRTKFARVDHPNTLHPSDLAPGLYAVLQVVDSGIGMDAKTQSRIFEPFFTTKEVGRGTGLGLSTVYGIVSQSGGAIQVQSAPGEGSSFTIYFPQARASIATLPGVAPVPEAREQTVLLVDDDIQVRKLVSRMLAGSGYVVLEAADGQEALDLLQQNGRRIALILTDVVMPRMDGHRLAASVQSAFPSLPVVLMSGHPETAHLKPEHFSGLRHYLRKPFRAEQLLDVVRRALREQTVTPR